MPHYRRHFRICTAIAGLLAAIAAIDAASQAPTAASAFEVASIKRSGSLDRGGRSGWEPGGRFRAVNVPGTQLISMAYGTPERTLLRYQVAQVPAWLDAARYDITGKVRTDLATASQDELGSNGPLFLQSLLEERFKLRVHRESRLLQRYRLVLARKDTLGPRLRRSKCVAPIGVLCKLEYLPGHFIFEGVALKRLADDLSGNVNVSRVIADDTGLAGLFDLDLEWSTDQSAPDKPSLFGALQEQLGLKLEAGQGPVDVVVIDHVERPVED